MSALNRGKAKRLRGTGGGSGRVGSYSKPWQNSSTILQCQDDGDLSRAELTHVFCRYFMGNICQFKTVQDCTIMGVVKAISQYFDFGLSPVSHEKNGIMSAGERLKAVSLNEVKFGVILDVKPDDCLKREILTDEEISRRNVQQLNSVSGGCQPGSAGHGGHSHTQCHSMHDTEMTFQPFFDDVDELDDDCSLNHGASHRQGDHWFPPEVMFKVNETKFNVGTSYRDTLDEEYTIPVDTSGPDFADRQVRADQLARLIEEESNSRRSAQLENNDENCDELNNMEDVDEEQKYSAVVRTAHAGPRGGGRFGAGRTMRARAPPVEETRRMGELKLGQGSRTADPTPPSDTQQQSVNGKRTPPEPLMTKLPSVEPDKIESVDITPGPAHAHAPAPAPATSTPTSTAAATTAATVTVTASLLESAISEGVSDIVAAPSLEEGKLSTLEDQLQQPQLKKTTLNPDAPEFKPRIVTSSTVPIVTSAALVPIPTTTAAPAAPPLGSVPMQLHPQPTPVLHHHQQQQQYTPLPMPPAPVPPTHTHSHPHAQPPPQTLLIQHTPGQGAQPPPGSYAPYYHQYVPSAPPAHSATVPAPTPQAPPFPLMSSSQHGQLAQRVFPTNSGNGGTVPPASTKSVNQTRPGSSNSVLTRQRSSEAATQPQASQVYSGSPMMAMFAAPTVYPGGGNPVNPQTIPGNYMAAAHASLLGWNGPPVAPPSSRHTPPSAGTTTAASLQQQTAPTMSQQSLGFGLGQQAIPAQNYYLAAAANAGPQGTASTPFHPHIFQPPPPTAYLQQLQHIQNCFAANTVSVGGPTAASSGNPPVVSTSAPHLYLQLAQLAAAQQQQQQHQQQQQQQSQAVIYPSHHSAAGQQLPPQPTPPPTQYQMHAAYYQQFAAAAAAVAAASVSGNNGGANNNNSNTALNSLQQAGAAVSVPHNHFAASPYSHALLANHQLSQSQAPTQAQTQPQANQIQQQQAQQHYQPMMAHHLTVHPHAHNSGPHPSSFYVHPGTIALQTGPVPPPPVTHQ